MIQLCLNERPHQFLRGDNIEKEKLHWLYLKIYFSRTIGSISTNFDISTKYSCVKGNELLTNKEPFNHPYEQYGILVVYGIIIACANVLIG